MQLAHGLEKVEVFQLQECKKNKSDSWQWRWFRQRHLKLAHVLQTMVFTTLLLELGNIGQTKRIGRLVIHK